MYWNNPLILINWPSRLDPIKDSLHNGVHCLFYDPAFDQKQIQYRQKLQDLCDWANKSIIAQGTACFLQNPQNHYDIANIVKLNMWIDDIRSQGIVKPMLVSYDNNQYTANNGESRLRALECVPEVRAVRAFISTGVKYQDQFRHLEPVTTFDQFSQLCGAVNGQKFLFRLTDAQAPHGLDWYEYDSQRTAPVTPPVEYCVGAIAAYLEQHPSTVFKVGWFAQLVDWIQYKNYQEQSDASHDHESHWQ
jgi:hypothetical protein